MYNRTGTIVTGEDFFPRNNIINLIYRRLEAGNHLFIAAPRRVGKSSIMYRLKDEPRSNFIFVYAVVQSVQDPEEFYKRLLEAIFESKAIGNLAKKIKTVGNLLEQSLKHIGSFDFWGVGMELKDKIPNYQQEFEKLVSKLDAENQTIVLMIDEFPDAILNIARKHDDATAIQFLQHTREQRQHATGSFRFIFTGSIGLPNVVTRLMPSNQVINDLNVVEIPPLSQAEATLFLEKLFASYKIPYHQDLIASLLAKIEWLIPFHLQLAFQEIIDVYDQTQGAINSAHLEQVFKQLLHHRNNIYLDHYYKRLEKEALALAILEGIAKKSTLKYKHLEQIAEKNQHDVAECRRTIEMLVFDGYIFKSESGVYRFNSFLLKMWWAKYVCN